MTTLVLQAAGGALGTAFGGPVGAVAGRVLGAAAGAVLDGALFGGGPRTRFVQGPRLTDVAGLASTEGAPIPRVYGRARVGGEIIWATRLEEVAGVSVERGAAAKGAARSRTVRTDYSYFANLAVGLCEGSIAMVRRIWADGREIDLVDLTIRIHPGSDDQPPDPLIVAKEGAERAPAYRGLAYVVFERLPLADYGNRVPQFSFEVVRPVAHLHNSTRAVCLIPGAGEFCLDPLPVTEIIGLGSTRPANRYQLQRRTDVLASLDALQAICPNVTRVAVVAAWFADDLRAGACTITPGVEVPYKTTDGDEWSVAGLSRIEARVVTRTPDGRPAYGGTPSDAGLGRLVAELKARGFAVTLYPFVMLDVPIGNALPDPHGGPSQSPYAWRGRITCDPAPGAPGSADGTGLAAAQVAAFFGTGAGFDYRRLIRHYATLAAGWGLDSFVIGSELVGLTRLRDGGGAYPAVAALREIAAEARALLGPAVKLVYGADWTEYGAHVRDGGAEVRFPLDPLFADPAIDAVGIDFYPPLADWRDTADHLDLDEAPHPYEADYLRRRVGAGEAQDWYYPDDAARTAQDRAEIADGAYGKPWIFRAKDLHGWWSSAHVERSGGVEVGPTAWVPASKPIWLTEVGVPAIDKGANGPNVFPDPKSAEGGLPAFSRGWRDELAQVAAVEAMIARFDPAAPGHEPGPNPVSPVYGGPMVDPGRVHVWAWDARPFPALPFFDLFWADATNWRVGHWVTGRIEGCPLDRLVATILDDLGVLVPRDLALAGWVDGYVIDRPMSARDALEPLADLFGLDAVDRAGRLAFTSRLGRRPALALARDDLVAEGERPLLTVTRAQETELPLQVQLTFTEGESPEYRRASVASRRLAGTSRREAGVEVAAVMRRGAAQVLADAWLREAWAGRETAALALSPRALALEPGDHLILPGGGLHRVTRILDEPGARRLETRAVDPAARGPAGAVARCEPFPAIAPETRPDAAGPRPHPPAIPGPPAVAVLTLAAARGEPVPLSILAVAADPWPGGIAVWRASGEGALALRTVVASPALIGETLTALPPGPVWRWDPNARLDVSLPERAALASVDDAAALAGANLFALRGLDGAWEILGAARAELVAARTWRLSRLLRGLGADDALAGRTVPAGATLVRLDDGGPVPLVDALDEVGRPFRYRIGPAGRDPTDASFVELTVAAGWDALRPPAPVHLAARRGPDGVRLTWIRRTRRDGDAWEPVEVPLAEEAERYAVAILGPADGVVRALACDAPAVLYPAALEAADFGAPQSVLRVRVAQVSAVAGAGFPRIATLTIA